MRQRNKTVSIDANVILRFLVGNDPELYKKAFKIIVGVESGRTIVICDPVNLAEVIWVMRKFYKLSNQRIFELLSPIVGLDNFLVSDKERYVLALELFANGINSFGDACACASAILDCEGRIYSFDKELSKVEGITRLENIELSSE